LSIKEQETRLTLQELDDDDDDDEIWDYENIVSTLLNKYSQTEYILKFLESWPL